MKVLCSRRHCVLVVAAIARGLMWISFRWIAAECGGGGGAESMVDRTLKFSFTW